MPAARGLPAAVAAKAAAVELLPVPWIQARQAWFPYQAHTTPKPARQQGAKQKAIVWGRTCREARCCINFDSFYKRNRG